MMVSDLKSYPCDWGWHRSEGAAVDIILEYNGPTSQELQSAANLCVYYYFDITQVKYDNLIRDDDGVVRTPPDPRDLDLTPTMYRCIPIQWDISGVALETLQGGADTFNQSSIGSGLYLRLSWSQIDSLVLFHSHCTMPINVDPCYEKIKLTMKVCINGTNHEFTRIACGVGGISFDLLRDDIVNEKCLSLDITLEVARVVLYDYHEVREYKDTDYGVMVDRADWEKHGVI